MRSRAVQSAIFAATVSMLILVTRSLAAAASGPDKPNFLIIVADDMGYSDAGCYGGEIATPNLDALAAGGLRYTQFYNTARCWPTRSALLSGYYPQQIRRDSMPGVDPAEFGGRGVRPNWARLIPEHLRPLGYRSYHSGKWHIDGKPTENGFDHSYHIKKVDSFFYADVHDKDDVPLPPAKAESGFFATTAVADHAIECLQEHAREHSGQPFFHYLAFFAPHFPLHALPEDIARYRDRYLEGWDKMRGERHSRQRDLGIVDTALSALEPNIGPPYDFPEQIAQLGPGEINRPIAWEQLNDEQRRFQATKMAIHAAMVDRLDREIGRVLDQLRKMDALDNTVIMFLSDNGASAELMVRGCGHDPSLPMGSNNTYLCLGPGFSSAANTPFRRHKTWVNEGGISTPFIVHWPDGISAKNPLRTTPAHVIDIAPTVLDLAGAESTADPAAPAIPGKSLKRTFEEDGPPLHEAIWFYHEGNWALRQGDWKIVHAIGTRPFPWTRSDAARNEGDLKPDWKLYHLATDRAEQKDLASQYPERAQEMAQLWFRYRDQFIRDAADVPQVDKQDRTEPENPAAECVQASGTHLTLGGKPYRALGVNIPHLSQAYMGTWHHRKPFYGTREAMRQAMIEAVEDAARHQVAFIRFFASPGYPKGTAELYWKDKEAYWRQMDEVFDLCRKHNLKLVPSLGVLSKWHQEFGEPRTAVFDANTKTHAATYKYVREFVTRYRNDPTVLMWELENEAFLKADVVVEGKPGLPAGVFPEDATFRRETYTAEDSLRFEALVRFYKEMTGFIKQLDPNHLVTSGDSGVRDESQARRETFPNFRWRKDTLPEHLRNLLESQPEPLDVFSLHAYGNFTQKTDVGDRSALELLREKVRAIHASGHPVFIGELGQRDPHFADDKQAKWARAAIDMLDEEGVSLIALWVWHFPWQQSDHNITNGAEQSLLMQRVAEFNQ